MFGYKLISEEEFNNLASLVGDQATTICSLHEELNRLEREKHNHRVYYEGEIRALVAECAELRNQMDVLRSELGAERWLGEGSEDVFERWSKQSSEMAFVEETG